MCLSGSRRCWGAAAGAPQHSLQRRWRDHWGSATEGLQNDVRDARILRVRPLAASSCPQAAFMSKLRVKAARTSPTGSKHPFGIAC